MAVTNASATPADLVTEMMAHAVTQEGMEQIYDLPYDSVAYYDYVDKKFVPDGHFGRTIGFGRIKTDCGLIDLPRYVKSKIRREGTRMYQIQAREVDEFLAQVTAYTGPARQFEGFLHPDTISEDEWRDGLLAYITGNEYRVEDYNSFGVNSDPQWSQRLEEMKTNLLTQGKSDAIFAATLLEEVDALARLTDESADMDDLVDTICLGIHRRVIFNPLDTMRRSLEAARLALEPNRNRMTDDHRLSLVKELEYLAAHSHGLRGRSLSDFEGELVFWKELLGATGTTRVNLAPRSNVDLHKDLTYYSELPSFGHSEFVVELLSLAGYGSIKRSICNPIEISQMQLDLLQATMSYLENNGGSRVTLDLDHFKVVEIHPADRDWCRQSSQAFQIDWSL